MAEERYTTSHDEDEDLLSVTSKDSSNNGYSRNQHYDFLKYDVKEDDPNTSMAKRKVFVNYPPLLLILTYYTSLLIFQRKSHCLEEEKIN